MLTKLMNAIGTQVGSWDPKQAAAKVKGKQLAQGRTRKAVEMRTLELEEARAGLTLAQNALGEAINAGEEASAARLAMTDAERRLSDLLNALAVAQSQEAAADRELRAAEQLADCDREEAAVAHLKFIVGPRIDAALDELQRLIREELQPAVEAAKAASGEGTSWLVDVSQGLEMLTAVAISEVSIKGRGYKAILRDKRFSDLVPDPATVRDRRKLNEQRRAS